MSYELAASWPPTRRPTMQAYIEFSLLRNGAVADALCADSVCVLRPTVGGCESLVS